MATNIEQMVSRFLAWQLPQDFAPDAGVSFVAPENPHCYPTGTNLLTALQAREMILHILGETESDTYRLDFLDAMAIDVYDLKGENAVSGRAVVFFAPYDGERPASVREAIDRAIEKVSA